MLKIPFQRIALAALLILACLPQYVMGAPWYQFEVIIFERIAKGAGSSEFWPSDPGTPSRLNALPLHTATSGVSGNSTIKVLPKSSRKLTELWHRLKRSRNYRPHLHLAWRQLMVRPDRAPLLSIEMMDKQNAPNRVKNLPKIEGTLKVGIKRYLHLETDLLLRRQKLGQPASVQPGLRPLGPTYQAYRLQTQRRMRSGKLHYLDHPLIGVLVLASKYQQPKPETEESAVNAGVETVPAESVQTSTPSADNQ